MQFPNLTSLLPATRWAVVGAAATRLYMPERATNDLDILILTRDAEAVRAQLIQAGAVYQSDLSIGGSAWVLPDGFPLDVLETNEAWAEVALQEAQSAVSVEGMPVLTLPYLVLMKFQASRVQDLADISRMLGQASEEYLAEVRAVFSQWQPEGLEDLESLIILGRLEMEAS